MQQMHARAWRMLRRQVPFSSRVSRREMLLHAGLLHWMPQQKPHASGPWDLLRLLYLLVSCKEKRDGEGLGETETETESVERGKWTRAYMNEGVGLGRSPFFLRRSLPARSRCCR